MEYNFFIDKRTEGLLYLNFPANDKEFQTRRSSNNGRSWHDIKFLNHNNSESSQSVQFKFHLHDAKAVPNHFEMIDIQYQDHVTALTPFITFDGGHSWKVAAKTKSNIILLNHGSVLLSVDKDTNSINYSFDEATTWLSYKLFSNNPKVLYIGRLSNNDLKAVIVSRDSTTKKIKFTTLDFSRIFNLDCNMSHYREWYLPTSNGFCYKGLKIKMRTRHSNILCMDKLVNHIKTIEKCSCVPDDFGCTFRYKPNADICVPDDVSIKKPDPKKCAGEPNEVIHLPG
ncbi:VPS10 domain-containing receptor SorCS1 [Thelohanellus kitauei]|uniref:VPS10 domain-containing receptor SorCS1 n=1 Tax=Thelohanellus kitauei TaxID=669202 RepID=A0A0C2MPM5_THEKT|nr:VPS10 domain-containing receptor SorCS1 [Thelohanellus kitauei]